MSKIGFPKKVLEKNKFAILIYKSPKGLKGLREKTRANLFPIWLDYRGVKHGSFIVFVTGLCVRLFISSSHF